MICESMPRLTFPEVGAYKHCSNFSSGGDTSYLLSWDITRAPISWWSKERKVIMAKRKMPEDEKRTHTVMMRFNDFEYSEISERAAESGLPVSTYVRQQAFYNDIVRHYNIVQDPEEIRKLVAEIGKIGSNLNQIARFLIPEGSDPLRWKMISMTVLLCYLI